MRLLSSCGFLLTSLSSNDFYRNSDLAAGRAFGMFDGPAAVRRQPRRDREEAEQLQARLRLAAQGSRNQVSCLKSWLS